MHLVCTLKLIKTAWNWLKLIESDWKWHRKSFEMAWKSTRLWGKHKDPWLNEPEPPPPPPKKKTKPEVEPEPEPEPEPETSVDIKRFNISILQWSFRLRALFFSIVPLAGCRQKAGDENSERIKISNQKWQLSSEQIFFKSGEIPSRPKLITKNSFQLYYFEAINYVIIAKHSSFS